MELVKTNRIIEDLPTKVFVEFMESLRQAGHSAAIISRLEQVHLNKQTHNEQALLNAIFGKEPT